MIKTWFLLALKLTMVENKLMNMTMSVGLTVKRKVFSKLRILFKEILKMALDCRQSLKYATIG